MGAFGILFSRSIRSWAGPKGILLLVAAALFPTVLTGAWVVTHQADFSIQTLDWTPAEPVSGDNVTIRAVVINQGRLASGAFNVTLAVGPLQGEQIIGDKVETFEVDSLAAGQTREFTFFWVATAGNRGVFVQADVENEEGELEEFNNVDAKSMLVRQKAPDMADAPTAPVGLEGNASASRTANVSIVSLDVDPTAGTAQDNLTVQARVRNDGPDELVNASVVVEAGRRITTRFIPSQSTSEQIDLMPGQETTVTLTWNNVPSGAYFARAYVNASADAFDPDTSNNHAVQTFTMDVAAAENIELPEIPERLTVKRFYVQMLLLHFWIVVPFIALFFAGGVISDDRNAGNLGQLLTLPIPRSAIPLARFVSGFLVSAVAVILSNVVSFLLLFGFTPEGDIGFLTTPMMAGVVALFCYGCVFTLMGVLFRRPYIAGIIYVLAWESLGLIDQLLQVSTFRITIQPADWVEKATILFNLGQALQNWPLDEGFLFLPNTGAGVASLRNIVLVGIGLLVLAMVAMSRREFDA